MGSVLLKPIILIISRINEVYVVVFSIKYRYNSFLVYCRELAPGTVCLTGDWAQGDDSKHDPHYIAIFYRKNINFI